MLSAAWEDYARAIDKEAHTTNTMLNFPPKKIDDHHIVVKVVNSMQVDALTNHKRAIEQYLARRLSTSIAIDIEIDDNIVRNQVFTPEEKLRKMLDANEAFNQMKLTLGLELI